MFGVVASGEPKVGTWYTSRGASPAGSWFTLGWGKLRARLNGTVADLDDVLVGKKGQAVGMLLLNAEEI